MSIGRRKFLKVLGFGTAAGPLATKAATDTVFAETVGLPAIPVLAYSNIDSAQVGMIPYASDMSWSKQVAMGADYLKLFGVPDFVEKEYRQKCVTALDPDLAAKKSWSMSVKIQEQKKRNYERQIETFKEFAWKEKKREVFKTVTGFRWPW